MCGRPPPSLPANESRRSVKGDRARMRGMRARERRRRASQRPFLPSSKAPPRPQQTSPSPMFWLKHGHSIVGPTTPSTTILHHRKPPNATPPPRIQRLLEGDLGDRSISVEPEGKREDEEETNESGGVGGSDTGTSVANRLVRDRELGKVVSSHLGLDLNGVCEKRDIVSIRFQTLPSQLKTRDSLKTLPL
jgi:hypothetical protein